MLPTGLATRKVILKVVALLSFWRSQQQSEAPLALREDTYVCVRTEYVDRCGLLLGLIFIIASMCDAMTPHELIA